MSKIITYKPFGEKAILIEWEAKISEEILENITSFKNKIEHKFIHKIEDCIIGYHSLTIIFKDYIDFASKENQLCQLYSEVFDTLKNEKYIWHIPVCYDHQFGIDLLEMSSALNLTIEEIIGLHAQASYTVYFIGFLPGFLYLGGLDNKLHFPRKANPRLNVAKGAVAIGGSQTGVYPQQSAGGWNIIGKTPISFFEIEKKQPCFARPGDKIQFIPVRLEEFNRIQSKIKNGVYQLVKFVIND